jgi:AbrB family looped-hinge helix DNA binding protein
MPTSRLTSRGLVTIPREVRKRLGLKQGDQLVFRVDRAGRLTVELQTPRPLGDLPGLLHHLVGDRPATIEQMKDTMRVRTREKVLSEKKG